eukprot:2731240-Rhodomonas_salina.5
MPELGFYSRTRNRPKKQNWVPTAELGAVLHCMDRGVRVLTCAMLLPEDIHRLLAACRDSSAGICRHACYAMPGTDISYDGVCLRVRYAMSNADTTYGTIGLYALCDDRTYIAYGGMYMLALRNARY